MFVLNVLNEVRTSNDFELLGYVESLSTTLPTASSVQRGVVWYRFKVFAIRKKMTKFWQVKENGYIKVALDKNGLEGSFLRIYGTLGRVDGTLREVFCSRFVRNDITKEWFFRCVSYATVNFDNEIKSFKQSDRVLFKRFSRCPILYRFDKFIPFATDSERVATTYIAGIKRKRGLELDELIERTVSSVEGFAIESSANDTDFSVRLARELYLIAKNNEIVVGVDFSDSDFEVIHTVTEILNNCNNIVLGKSNAEKDIVITFRKVGLFLSFNIR